MTNWLPVIIGGSIVAGLLALRGGYVAHYNLNDPDENYQIGSRYNDNSIFTGYFTGVPKGGGKKTRHRKYKTGKNTRKK
jgi:hypothetical protein